MPTNLPVKCKVCGAKVADGVKISRNALCIDCAVGRATAAIKVSARSAERTRSEVDAEMKAMGYGPRRRRQIRSRPVA